jgi:hypothetical protein
MDKGVHVNLYSNVALLRNGTLPRPKSPIFPDALGVNTGLTQLRFGSNVPAALPPKASSLRFWQRFLRWAKQGMPLIKQISDEDRALEKTMPFTTQLKGFVKRRGILAAVTTGVAGGLIGITGLLGGDFSRVFPPEPCQTMNRSDHPDPWPDNVKIYASVSQNAKAPTWGGLGGQVGGVFSPALASALKKSQSLDEAFEAIKGGYGPVGQHHPVSSAEGPHIFNKAESKRRLAILVVGGGMNDAGENFTADLRADIEGIRKTLTSEYHMVPWDQLQDKKSASSIIVLDQPGREKLVAAMRQAREAQPDEILIYFAGEGAAIETLGTKPHLKDLEGGREGGIDVSNGQTLFKDDLKKIIRREFAPRLFVTPPKIAMVFDSCGAGAFTQ